MGDMTCSQEKTEKNVTPFYPESCDNFLDLRLRQMPLIPGINGWIPGDFGWKNNGIIFLFGCGKNPSLVGW